MKKAIDNTRELAESWIEQYRADHPDVTQFEIDAKDPVQLPLL